MPKWSPRLLVAFAAALMAIVVLPAAATADNNAFTYSGTVPDNGCATNDFTVTRASETVPTTAHVTLLATVFVNDFAVDLVHNGVRLHHEDTGAGQETFVQQLTDPGVYTLKVCKSPTPVPPGLFVPPLSYQGTVVLTEAVPPIPACPPIAGGILGCDAQEDVQPQVSFSTLDNGFSPATLVSAHIICAEPQLTAERAVAGSQAGATDPNRIFSDCPVTSRTQTSILSRSTDGGNSFRLLLDPRCTPRNRPNCLTAGGGDSEEEVNLINGHVYFADQEVVANEALAYSPNHGDSFSPVEGGSEAVVTNPIFGVDRQWLGWVNPSIPGAQVAGQPLDAFLTYHLPGAGEYIQGITNSGVAIPQPVPQIPEVGQSGQVRVDNSPSSHGFGWIYQPYGGYVTNGGIFVAVAPASAFQDPTAWREIRVSKDSRALFVWVGLDDHGNSYLVWVSSSAGNAGQLYLAMSPIDDSRNDPTKGGKPGTYWTKQVQINPSSLQSTAFPEVIGGADGRIAVSYMGSPDCGKGSSDNCPDTAHWNTYVDLIPTANLLPQKGAVTPVTVAQVTHRTAHRGQVCTAGTTCTGDRSLLDMIDVTYDQSGRATVVWSDNNNALAAPNYTDRSKGNSFIEVAKQVAGPSLTGGDVNVSIPTGGRSDPAGDATWPNTSSGRNLPAFDLTSGAVTATGTELKATFGLANATTGGMTSSLAAFNAAWPTDPKDRIQYIVRFETAQDVFHVSAEFQAGNLRFFGGKLNANDGVQNGTGTNVGARYVADSGYRVTGSVANDGHITLSAPLSDFGLHVGDTIRNVTVFATAQPSEASPTGNLVVNSGRTVDATPPFDAVLQPEQPQADIAVRKTAAPDPVKHDHDLTYRIQVTNNGPDDATDVTMHDALPAKTELKSVSATQGTCTSTTGEPAVVDCSLGNLANGASATITIVVKVKAKGVVSNTASAKASSPPDPVLSNNSSTATVTVSD